MNESRVPSGDGENRRRTHRLSETAYARLRGLHHLAAALGDGLPARGLVESVIRAGCAHMEQELRKRALRSGIDAQAILDRETCTRPLRDAPPMPRDRRSAPDTYPDATRERVQRADIESGW